MRRDPNGKFCSAEPFPLKERSLAELIRHRRIEAKRMKEYESATHVIPINLATSGPIGIAAFGDPHIDNPGCDFNLLESHLKLAADRPEYVFSGNMGDSQDNWVGRLGRLYESTTVSGKEAWQLVEWLVKGCGVNWTWFLRGNHDAWAGKNDPLDWIIKGANIPLDKHWGARIRFRHPNGSETTMHARHDFSGSSIFNPLHALKKETLHGYRDDILIAAHRHHGADARDINGDGAPFVMVRTAGYKVSDSYAFEKGFHSKPLHPAVMIVVDPDKPKTAHDRVWVAPTIEVGADYLDFMRQRFNSRPRLAPKRRR